MHSHLQGKKTVYLFLFYADKSPYARGQSLNFEVKISGDKLENDSDSLKNDNSAFFSSRKPMETPRSCWFIV